MSDDARARRYHAVQLALGVASLVLTAAYLVAILVAGGGVALASRLEAAGAPWEATLLVVAAALGGGRALLTAPLAWLRGFWLPRHFGLLHQPLRGWLADRAKAAAIGGPLALAAVLVVYALLRVTPWWWLIAAAVFFVAYVVIAIVLPIWVLPLFHRLTPLEDAALRARLLALAARAGVPAIGVWVADQSRKSRTANAAVVGLGRTRRIVLYDTLVAQFRPHEIEAVLAHELGHHAHGDIRRGLLAQGALTLATLAVADGLLAAGPWLWGYPARAHPGSLPWLALVLLGLGLAAAPLGNGFSRWIERQADDFALASIPDGAALADALERLAGLNLAERRPHRLKEIFLHSHPALDRRIARARARAA
jgi:STE24 endopeptidase